MTISSETFRWSYTSTGGTTYQYTNKILDEDDLKVYVDAVLQTIGTHYTVSGVGTATGGNVVFLAAPAAASVVLITKDGVEFTQDHDYTENDAFPAASHEDALDKQMNALQKVWDYVRRSIKVAITSDIIDIEFPTPEAGKALAWNGTADAIENITLAGTGAISDTAYNSSTWDSITDIAPSKNAVRDKLEAMISDTAYNSTSWDSVDTVAPSKNSVRDQIETMLASIAALISDTAYNSTTWDNVTTVAPSKNAVRDKFESLPQNANLPAFLAYNSVTDENVTGDGTAVTVDFNTEVFDQANNFSGDTFTAPITGKYQLNVSVYFNGLETGDILNIVLTTTKRNYSTAKSFSYANETLSISVLADMDATDTAYVTASVTGGDKDADIYGGADAATCFSGFLVC